MPSRSTKTGRTVRYVSQANLSFARMQTAERRNTPRIYGSFPVRVRGRDSRGVRFEVDSVIDNLSATGLYVRIPKLVARGAHLFVVFRISGADSRHVPAVRIAARLLVTRAEPQPDEATGVGGVFLRMRFLSPWEVNLRRASGE